MVNDAYAPELLCSLFLYDPVTGRLHHKANRRRVKAGSMLTPPGELMAIVKLPCDLMASSTS